MQLEITSIDSVVERLTAIQAATVDTIGVPAFNQLYLSVTEAVKQRCAVESYFQHPEWIERLDVVFAHFYFDAVDAHGRGDSVPRAWRPLFVPHKTDVADVHPLQFALAGMNAHINHDLVFAIIRTCQELDLTPRDHTPHHQDFTKVNSVLGDVEDSIKSAYDQGCIGDIDRRMGRIDDMFVMWNVGHAREMAWDWAGLLWPMRDDPELFTKADKLIGRMVGFAGRGMTTLRLG
jgi:hypothetical protein